MKSPLLYLSLALVLVLFAALIGPWFVDWSQYRDRLEAYGEQLTGRKIAISGPIKVRLLPAPVLRMTGVGVANAEDAGSAALMSVKRIEARLAVAPLVSGKLHVTSLRLEEPVIEIERLEGGRWNVRFDADSGLREYLGAEDVQLETVEVTGGTVYLRDAQRGGVARLDDVELTLSATTLAGPFRLDGTATHEGSPIVLHASAGKRRPDGSLRFNVRLNPGDDETLSYVFDGEYDPASEQAGVRGQLRIRREVPGDREAVTGVADLPFSVVANATASAGKLDLEDISLFLDSSRTTNEIRGRLSLTLADTLVLEGGLEAGHFDLDTLLARFDAAALAVPGLDTVESLHRLLGLLPRGLDGRMTIGVNALTVNGEVIEGASARIDFSPDRIRVADLRGRLPGRAEMRFSGMLDRHAPEPRLVGDLSVKAQDTRKLIGWALPSQRTWFDRHATGSRGDMRFTSRVSLSPRELEFSDARLALDRSEASGRIAITPGVRPWYDVDVSVGEIDLTRYFPRTAEAAQDPVSAADNGRAPVDDFITWASQIDPAGLNTFDARVKLRIDRLSRYDFLLRGLDMDLSVVNGDLDVRSLSVAEVEDIGFTTTGRVTWIGGAAQAGLSGTLTAADPVAAIRALGLDDGWGAAAQSHDLLARAGRVDLRWRLDSTEDTQRNVDVDLEGSLGTSTLSASGSLRGRLDDRDSVRLRVEASIANPASGALLAQLGLASAETPEDGNAGVVRVGLDGSLDAGIDASLGVEVFGALAAVQGTLQGDDGRIAVDGEFTVRSEQPAALYRALGIADDSDALDLHGTINGVGPRVAIADLRGAVGGNAIAFDGSIDLGTAVPTIEGRLKLDRLVLPWVLDRLLDRPVRVASGPVVEVAARSEPIWPSEAFPSDMLSTFAADLELDAGEVVLTDGVSMSATRARLSVRDGRLSVRDLAAAVFGGSLALDLQAVSDAGELGVEADFRLDGARLEETLGRRAGRPPAAGSYSLTGDVRGKGRSVVGLVSSLAGSGTFQLAGGSIDGVNPGAFAEAMASAASAAELDGIIDGVLRDGRMPFAGGKGEFTIAGGLVRFAEYPVDSPAATGTMITLIDLADLRIDSEWRLSLRASKAAPPLQVVVAGPLADPVRSYDTQELRSHLVVKGLSEGVSRLEELQRQEQEELQKLEQMEREARLEAERRERERRAAEEEARRREEEQRRLQEAIDAAIEAPAESPPEVSQPAGSTSDAAVDDDGAEEDLPDAPLARGEEPMSFAEPGPDGAFPTVDPEPGPRSVEPEIRWLETAEPEMIGDADDGDPEHEATREASRTAPTEVPEGLEATDPVNDNSGGALEDGASEEPETAPADLPAMTVDEPPLPPEPVKSRNVDREPEPAPAPTAAADPSGAVSQAAQPTDITPTPMPAPRPPPPVRRQKPNQWRGFDPTKSLR